MNSSDKLKQSMELQYNYVYFNAANGRRWMVDKNEYNAICLKDLDGIPGVQVVPCPLSSSPPWIRKIYCLHTSQKTNFLFKIPFQKLWYPYFFKDRLPQNNKKYCFVIARRDLPIDYFKYLRKKYPGCKLVKLHRDLVKIDHQSKDYSEENMNRLFDLRMSYDKNEAERLGIVWFDEIESLVEIKKDDQYPLYDVFFAGKAKDRLEKIIKAYDILSAAGLKCCFYVTNVEESQKIERPGITYSDKYMPYLEMLNKSINSRCMLDINQGGAVGYTSRFLEAVMYNKKIIIDNPSVLESKFYNPDFIHYVANMDEIDPEFVNRDVTVDYNYQGEFSPINLILQIDNELVKMDKEI